MKNKDKKCIVNLMKCYKENVDCLNNLLENINELDGYNAGSGGGGVTGNTSISDSTASVAMQRISMSRSIRIYENKIRKVHKFLRSKSELEQKILIHKYIMQKEWYQVASCCGTTISIAKRINKKIWRG